jgi:ABC-2 type transport system permease protein
MTPDVTTLDLRLRGRAQLGYVAGMAIYAFVIVALYPAFRNDTSLNQFTANGSPVAALFGATGSLTSPPGWVNANLYANFVPLIVLVLSIGYGASAIAGQDEDATLSLIATLPISRRQIATQKFIAMSLQTIPVAVVTALCVVAGRGFSLPIPAAGVLGVTVGVVLLGIDFGAIALLVGAATGRRAIALGASSALAAVSYLLGSLAPVIDWLHAARFASLFYYAVGDGQLVHGISVTDAAILAAVAAVALYACLVAFDRLDLH